MSSVVDRRTCNAGELISHFSFFYATTTFPFICFVHNRRFYVVHVVIFYEEINNKAYIPRIKDPIFCKIDGGTSTGYDINLHFFHLHHPLTRVLSILRPIISKLLQHDMLPPLNWPVAWNNCFSAIQAIFF